MEKQEYIYNPVPRAPLEIQHNLHKGQLWRQYIIAGIANIAMVSGGYAMGWTSPIALKLRDVNLTDSPLPIVITVDQESCITSALSIGAIFGASVAGPLAARIGRKWTLISACLPQLIGWILIAVASSVQYLYGGRVLWGISVGMLFTVTPMYCAEVATNDRRGALGSFMQVSLFLGFLLVYSIGPYVSYFAIAYVAMALVVFFLVPGFFMPETPMYHLSKNDRESAAKCLMTIRGQSRAGVEAELGAMASDVAASMAKTATIADVFRGSNFKAFYISCALVSFQQLGGINAVLFYLNTIFQAAGARLDPSVATIIVGVVQLIASSVTPFVADRLGRRVLLLISCAGAGISLGGLGLFFLLKDLDSPAVDYIGFLPVLSLMLFTIAYCLGLAPMTWAVLAELFPIEVKAVAATIATAFCWVLVFFITRYFGPISEALGMYVAFWIFGVFCTIGFFFVLFFLPETKGKSFAEIQELLSGRKSRGIAQASKIFLQP